MKVTKNLQGPQDVSTSTLLLNGLIHSFDLYSDYTTRTPEILASKHQIISQEEIEQYIRENELVEYDKTGGYYSGTSIKQIKVVMEAGKTCLLRLQPQVCGMPKFS